MNPNDIMMMCELAACHEEIDKDGSIYYTRENVVANVNDEFLKYLAYTEARVWLYKITGCYDGVKFDPMWRW